MNSEQDARRQSPGMTRRSLISSSALAVGGVLFIPGTGWCTVLKEEISHTSESIHHEPIFKASPKRVYGALTDANQFEQVIQLSAAVKSGEVPKGKHAVISPEVGGAFSLFGGLITGRHVELVPNQRIVQAWRAATEWKPGIYSIVRFELMPTSDGTRIVFDHRGFPDGDWKHLAAGWKANYWEPLAQYLAQVQHEPANS